MARAVEAAAAATSEHEAAEAIQSRQDPPSQQPRARATHRRLCRRSWFRGRGGNRGASEAEAGRTEGRQGREADDVPNGVADAQAGMLRHDSGCACGCARGALRPLQQERDGKQMRHHLLRRSEQYTGRREPAEYNSQHRRSSPKCLMVAWYSTPVDLWLWYTINHGWCTLRIGIPT